MLYGLHTDHVVSSGVEQHSTAFRWDGQTNATVLLSLSYTIINDVHETALKKNFTTTMRSFASVGLGSFPAEETS